MRALAALATTPSPETDFDGSSYCVAEKNNPKKNPGPDPEVFKVDLQFEEAVKAALKTPPPPPKTKTRK